MFSPLVQPWLLCYTGRNAYIFLENFQNVEWIYLAVDNLLRPHWMARRRPLERIPNETRKRKRINSSEVRARSCQWNSWVVCHFKMVIIPPPLKGSLLSLSRGSSHSIPFAPLPFFRFNGEVQWPRYLCKTRGNYFSPKKQMVVKNDLCSNWPVSILLPGGNDVITCVHASKFSTSQMSARISSLRQTNVALFFLGKTVQI